MLEPEPKDAKYLTRKFEAPIAIIIVVDPANGLVAGASWGTDLSGKGNWQPVCKQGGELMEEALAAIQKSLIGDLG